MARRSSFGSVRPLPSGRWQALSIYLDLFAEFRKETDAEKESINDDIVFEIELIKQVEVNVDYVLMLVRKYLDENGPGEDKEVRAAIDRAVDSSPSLRNKKDLIEQFVDSLTVDAEVDAEWQAFIAGKRWPSSTRSSPTRASTQTRPMRSSRPPSATEPSHSPGPPITGILPPVSRFTPDGLHATKKQTVLDKLASSFFDRYFGLT